MRKLILFTLLSISLIGCKKEEVKEPDFNIVGAWANRGIVSMKFLPTGEYNKLYKYSVTKLTYPHFLINVSSVSFKEKIVIKVLNPDKFEIVNGIEIMERVK